METKSAFKLVKTTGQCIKVHRKFLIVTVLLAVPSQPRPTRLCLKELRKLSTLKQKLGRLVTTASPLKKKNTKEKKNNFNYELMYLYYYNTGHCLRAGWYGVHLQGGRTLVRTLFPCGDRLVGLVVKASASRAEDPGLESRLRRDFFGVESYQ